MKFKQLEKAATKGSNKNQLKPSVLFMCEIGLRIVKTPMNETKLMKRLILLIDF